MPGRIRSAAGVLLTCAAALPAAGQTYDLRSDWSDSINPNGRWSYREAANPLPKVASWAPGGWTTPQPAWASGQVPAIPHIPAFLRSNGTETFAHDWITGDVMFHTTDSGSGPGLGTANIAWTSPVDGVITISGAVWIGRDIGRTQQWVLRHNAAALAQGIIASGDVYSRANPFTFAAGAAVPAALIDRAVSRGDEIRLEGSPVASPGDFIAADFTVLVCIGLTEQPQSLGTCPSGVIELRAQGAGPGMIAHRWKRETMPGVFVNIVDGPTGTGSVISGAMTGMLRIEPGPGGALSDADDGNYACEVTSACASLMSAVAAVNVTCAADLNCDGLVDFSDYLAFLNLYDAQDPEVDFNQDGLVDFSDYLEFLNLYDSGC
ncbi:MAG: hypothetical protein IT436_02810 [Phycisphaerales bacterium]|nr:hypothetical protein [Phycisphaerales bacterium]